MDAMELLSTRASQPKLGEPAPDDATLDRILTAALRAPDHARLRPWKVLALRGEARARLGDVFAEAKAAREPGVSAEEIERARRKPLRAPLLIVVAATPVEHAVPEIEQILSAGAVAHAILLGLQATGFAGMWRTGSVAYDPKVKLALGLRPADHLVAFLYAGSPTVEPPAVERPTVDQHVERWTG